VAAVAEGFACVSPSGEFALRLPVLGEGTRMNDAKCDALGRFWAGSNAMDFEPGRGLLHVLIPDWSTRVLLDGLTLPNGMGWSADGRTFYLVDTMEGALDAFDHDPDGPTLTNRRRLLSILASDGLPDGLTVDASGCLWIALWGGAQVIRVSPDGDILDRLEMPVRQPSSCAFGGSSFDTLFVTSAGDGLDGGDDALDGSVFRVTELCATGVPSTRFAG
jgi:sugar lactone lactonase YvrE